MDISSDTKSNSKCEVRIHHSLSTCDSCNRPEQTSKQEGCFNKYKKLPKMISNLAFVLGIVVDGNARAKQIGPLGSKQLINQKVFNNM